VPATSTTTYVPINSMQTSKPVEAAREEATLRQPTPETSQVITGVPNPDGQHHELLCE